MTSESNLCNSTSRSSEIQIQDGAEIETQLYNLLDHNITSEPENYYDVEESRVVDVICVFVLVVGCVGNLLGIFIFRCPSKTKKPMVLDKIVSYLFATGLTTTLLTTPLHLYASKTNLFPADRSLCQVQGLLLNFLFLLCLWYTAVMSTERFLRIVSPHEHRLTFSPLNLNVILAGVSVLLVVEVSGPIYGWAEYGFLNDCTVCLLNPKSNHIWTYSVIYVACYVALPVVTIFGFCGYIILSGVKKNQRLSNGSQVLKSGNGIMILCLAMITTTLLLLPYHTTLLLQAMLFSLPVHQKVICYWLHIAGVTCVYPIVLVICDKDEIFPILKSFFKKHSNSTIIRRLSSRRKSEFIEEPNSENFLVEMELRRGNSEKKTVEMEEKSTDNIHLNSDTHELHRFKTEVYRN